MLATSEPQTVNYDPQDMCMTMSLSSAQVPSQLRHQRHPACLIYALESSAATALMLLRCGANHPEGVSVAARTPNRTPASSSDHEQGNT